MDWIENEVFQHFGFSESQITEIDDRIPKAAFVMAWVKQHKTVLLELIDTAEMMSAQIAKHQKENQ